MWKNWFGWQGALVAFLNFNAFKGVDMMKQAYAAIYENRTSSPEINAQAEGRGYVINCCIQMIFTTAAGGYVCRKRTEPGFGITAVDCLLVAVIAVIMLWDKAFPKNPLWRRQCTSIANRTVTGRDN